MGKGLYPFLAEFDIMPFPAHCINAYIGSKDLCPTGAKCLDLRKVFKVNLAGIQHIDGCITWFPRGATCLRKGDSGLFIRVPPPGDGPWQSFMPSLALSSWEDISEENEFRKKMGLQDITSWSEWTRVTRQDPPF